MAALSTMLNEVESAISALLTGALEYRVGSRMVRRSDLDMLRAWRRELKNEIADESGWDMPSLIQVDETT